MIADKYKIVTAKNGIKKWYLNGKLHREGSPAIEFMTIEREEWWLDGLRHREDGPAITCYDGYRAWYIDGVFIGQRMLNE